MSKVGRGLWPSRVNTVSKDATARMNTQNRPRRRALPHDIPSWVESGARYFVTVNCCKRGSDELCRAGVAESLMESIGIYEGLGRWYVWLALIMPDHVHLIATFDLERGIKNVVSSWKGYHAKASGIQWQSGFFEHRLRDDDEFSEKVSYIRMNPVRKGLAETRDAWPHVVDRCNGAARPEASPYLGKN